VLPSDGRGDSLAVPSMLEGDQTYKASCLVALKDSKRLFMASVHKELVQLTSAVDRVTLGTENKFNFNF